MIYPTFHVFLLKAIKKRQSVEETMDIKRLIHIGNSVPEYIIEYGMWKTNIQYLMRTRQDNMDEICVNENKTRINS